MFLSIKIHLKIPFSKNTKFSGAFRIKVAKSVGSLTVRGEIFLKIIGLQFGKVNYLFVYL